MDFSNELIKQFSEITTNEDNSSTESTCYGSVVKYNGELYVRIDGSETITPIETTAELKTGERVLVTIKNHVATVIGNITNPSASVGTVGEIQGELDIEKIRVDNLFADNVTIGEHLSANTAEILDLIAKNVVIEETLEVNDVDIENLKANKADIEDLTAAEGRIGTLEADNIIINKGLDANSAKISTLTADLAEFENATVETLTANDAEIRRLEAEKLSVENAELQYAQIDFANIGEAAVEKLFAESGIIKDIIVSDGKITGELVGVTIKGDLIEAGTLMADKLVIKGEDGLYYKLNTDGETVESEQTEYNSLDGKHILAKSITATKIAVDDLVAFNATIGGFNITNQSLYSGTKADVHNSNAGIYQDKTGQFAVGDGNNYLKFYKNQNGDWVIDIAASSITIGSTGKNVEDELKEIRDEVTTNLRIESSRGTVFKNDSISTVLSAVIFRGSQRITDITTLREAMGNTAYLQWKWQRLDETSFGVISASDSRLGNNGFTFTLSPDDVNTKVTFMCELIV